MKIDIGGSSGGWYEPYILIKDADGESVYVEISDLRKFINDLEQIAKDYGV